MADGPLKIVITTGDTDGIGTEVAAKALAKVRPKRGVQFYLWRSKKMDARFLRRIDGPFKRKTVLTWAEALKEDFDYKTLIDIDSNLSPVKWVETTAKSSLHQHVDAMVTAPLSKTLMANEGVKQIGHTELLRKITKADHVFMSFIGSEFSVVLATTHVPVRRVSKRLTPEVLEQAILAADRVRAMLPSKQAKLPLGVLGLNPHAGEGGLIGDEEIQLKPVLQKLKKRKVQLEGFLVPDAAFFPENFKKYSVFVCPYHDQGLIPFKLVHGQKSGVHITMGLPIIRTSVDHGTAKNIFGMNKADPGSMIDAINWAITLAKKDRGQ